MRKRGRGQRPGSAIVFLLLVPIFGCAIQKGAGPGIKPATGGSIAGRVEFVGPGGGMRLQGNPPGRSSGAVVVYLEPSDDSVETRATVPEVEIRIGAGRQEPPLVVVQPDQPFRFLNLDPIHHEPFSLDTPNDFQIRAEGGRVSGSVRLSQNGFVRAFCRLHPAESFVVIVSPALHVVSVKDDGSFEIPNVRAGLYRIRAAGLDVESAVMPVQVARGAILKLALRLSPRST